MFQPKADICRPCTLTLLLAKSDGQQAHITGQKKFSLMISILCEFSLYQRLYLRYDLPLLFLPLKILSPSSWNSPNSFLLFFQNFILLDFQCYFSVLNQFIKRCMPLEQALLRILDVFSLRFRFSIVIFQPIFSGNFELLG